MDRVGARLERGADDRVTIEVRAAQGHDLVRAADPPGTCLVLRDERKGTDPELAARPRDPDDELAAVGYEQALDASATDAHLRAPSRKRAGVDPDVGADTDGWKATLAQPA